MSQEGTLHLEGLTGVAGSHNIQIVPYVLGQNEHTLETLDPTNPYWSTRNAEATAGGEAKAVLKDSIVLDATVNPDFSDVESDQPQFTVNQRYPVYFPELRPFFLENASYFATPLTLLYTRNIVRPEIGGRVTGKIGHTNIGVLAINDREPGEHGAAGRSAVWTQGGILCGARVAGSGQGIECGADVYGRGVWRRVESDWRRGFYVEAEQSLDGAGADGGELDDAEQSAEYGAVFPAGYHAGPAADLQVQRSGHAFNMFDEYQDISKRIHDAGGILADVEYSQRPSACDLPVVSEAQEGAELRAGDESEYSVRSRA